MHDLPKASWTHLQTRMTRPAQLRVVAVAALVGVALLLLPALPGLFRKQETRPAAAAPGSFRPTDNQWAALQIEAAGERAFRAVQRVDGVVAIDDDRSTPVFSPYSGRVAELVARPGDSVRKGDPLFLVEATEFVQAQSDLTAAVGTLSSTRAAARLAETNERRQHELFLAKGAAQRDWQQAEADSAAAQAALHNAEAALGAVRNRLRILGVADAELAALERGGGSPPAARTRVTAPIDGTVLQRQVATGQYIQAAAANAVYTIGDMSRVWLLANVPESAAASVRVGQTVEARLLALPGQRFTATVTYVGATLDPATHRLPVRAELANPDGLLKPAMFVDLDIATSQPVTSPTIPARAIVHEGDTAHVWLANGDRSLTLRQVRCGLNEDGFVQILEGVAAGEQVVTSGALFIDRAANGS